MKAIQGIDVKSNLGQYDGGIGAVTALLGGVGASSAPAADQGAAGKNWWAMYTRTTAASGDNRGLYWKHQFAGAGAGEVARLWAVAKAAGVAAGGTMNALHATASIDASCSVSGALNAIRATISAAASATMGGTGAAVQLDSDIATGLSVPATWAFLRVSDSGVVRVNQLLNIPPAANGTLFAAHTTQTMTHSIKIVDANGTAYYIMCTNAATNRS